MISLFRQKLYEHYFNDEIFKTDIERIFKDKCSEGCALKGDLRDYVILDGDVIQECMHKDDIKSVDCILLNKNSEGKINILLCKLNQGTSGKSVTDVKKKMEDSGKHIFNLCNEEGFEIKHFKCLYLGRYSLKPTKPSLIRVSIEGSGLHNITILNKPCGFILKDSFFA